jgi:taurine dioxygenase
MAEHASTGVWWEPLADAPFGARVELDQLDSIDDDTAATLRNLLAQHHVLVFPRAVSEHEHVRLVACFGRVLPQGPRVLVNDRPEGTFPIVTIVSNVLPNGSLGTFELGFHHDLGHVPTPLAGLSLYAMDVADGQTATRFANGRRAYQRLPASLQERLEGLQSLFSANYTATSEHPVTARDARDGLDPTWPRVVHPVVVPHPVTGERCVYVNEMMTVGILGIPEAESDALLDVLFAGLYAPDNIYEHRWTTGDLVVWDNLVVQHARRQVEAAAPRTLRRVVFGEKAPWESWPFAPPTSSRSEVPG